MTSDILALDATAQAEAIARGDVTALELLEAAIAAADAAEIGAAIPIRFDDLARGRAKEQLAGPFARVPFLLKDLRQEFAGQLHTAGAAPWRQRIAPEHSAYTRRCLEAGLVMFGRTATPELGLRATTESRLWIVGGAVYAVAVRTRVAAAVAS